MMIKVEIASILDIRCARSQLKYNAIKDWSFKYSGLTHHKVEHSRNHVYFYNEESFEIFKNTYKETWRRVY